MTNELVDTIAEDNSGPNHQGDENDSPKKKTSKKPGRKSTKTDLSQKESDLSDIKSDEIAPNLNLEGPATNPGSLDQSESAGAKPDITNKGSTEFSSDPTNINELSQNVSADTSPISGDSTLGEDAKPQESATTPIEEAPASNLDWYIVQVQSGREESTKAALERKVKVDQLEQYFGRIIIPFERVKETIRGKTVEKKKKKFPGYLMVELEFNDKILYLFRETAGIIDFVGGSEMGRKTMRAPTPMPKKEIEKMLADEGIGDQPESEQASTGRFLLKFGKGDRVKVQQGTFAGMEGEVKEILQSADPKEPPKIRVEVVIWNRPVPVEVEHWQVEVS